MVVAPCVVGVWWVRGVSMCVDVCGREVSVLCGRKTGLPRLYLRGGRPPQADVVEGILRESQQPNGISEVDDSIMSVLYLQRLCTSTMGQS